MPPIEVVQDPERFTTWLGERLFESGVPSHLHEGLQRYVVHHIPTGSFLLAVLSNDLREACARADTHCQSRIWNIVYFLVNYCPLGCWGSTEHVRAWLENRPRLGGLMGTKS